MPGKIYECINGRVDQIHTDIEGYIRAVFAGAKDEADKATLEEIRESIARGINYVINYTGTATGGLNLPTSLPVVTHYEVGDEVKELKL